MNARTLLFRHLQSFFEVHLASKFKISDVVFHVPEMAEKVRGQRQLPHEMVCGNFGIFTIEISSPEKSPPLGHVLCSDNHGNHAEGPIDAVTWQRIAAMIMAMPHREAERMEYDDRGGNSERRIGVYR
jgi:hypothetical protein